MGPGQTCQTLFTGSTQKEHIPLSSINSDLKAIAIGCATALMYGRFEILLYDVVRVLNTLEVESNRFGRSSRGYVGENNLNIWQQIFRSEQAFPLFRTSFACK